MVEHTVRSFTQDLEELSSDLLRMGGLAESLLEDATRAIINADQALGRDVIERDKEVDALQIKIEHSILKLLALRQPLAHDLRTVITALKVANDLERVGDLAKNIARRTIAIGEDPSLPGLKGLERMSRAVSLQLKNVLDAYTTGNSGMAHELWLRDEEIDEHYNSIFREVLTYMMEDPRNISHCTHLLFIAKNLERIGDHCTNIAEEVFFLVTGESLAIDRPKVPEFDTKI